jgi:hypothetical protein
MFADSRQRAASREPDLADLDLHRIDLAARLLAPKHPAHTPEGLISAAAGTCSADAIDGDPVGVGLFIAELVRHSDAGPGVLDSDRAMFAAERLAELLAALVEPGDLATIRALRRGGARERPLPLPSQRRIRRACLRLRLPSAGRVRGLVLNNAGAVHLASGDRPQAGALCLDTTRIANTQVACSLPTCSSFALEDGDWISYVP